MVIKNLKPDDLMKFRAEGSVLVGSFFRYRKLEGQGRDDTEGIKGVDLKVKGPLSIRGDNLGKLVSYVKVKGPFKINIGGTLTIKDATLLPDAYIFCTSLKVRIEFGAAHYKIVDVLRFGETLFRSLHETDNDVFYWAHGRAVYGGHKDPVTTPEELANLGSFNINEFDIDDYFRKPAKYAEEQEYRFVFLTRRQPVPEQTIIFNKELVDCCYFL